MYQRFVNLLLELGYQKYMTQIGPVYMKEEDEDRRIVYLTYHKDQQRKPVYMKERESDFRQIKETIFGEQPADILCILIVDDEELLKKQTEKSDLFSMWIQNEKTGKLYISKDSDLKFKDLFSVIEKYSHEAKKELEQSEKEEKQKSTGINWKPYVTPVNVGIIILNVIIFLISQYMVPDLVNAGASEWSAILLGHEWYRLITSMFLHFDLEHLVSNMVTLFLIGSFVEHYFGSLKYAVIYFVCGLAGNLLSFYLDIGTTSIVLSAGASGAIYGILGALAVMLLKKRGRLEGAQGPGLVIFVIGMIFHSYQSIGVDNMAHIGGLITGILCGIFIKEENS